MHLTVTPNGMGPVELDLIGEPEYELAEQGGFRDATFTAEVPDRLVDRMRLATVRIDGHEPRYYGCVESVDGNTVTCRGWQSRLDHVLKGRLYGAASADQWVPTRISSATPSIGIQTQESPNLVQFTWTKGIAYAANAYNGVVFYLPESQSVSVVLSWAAGEANTNVQILSYNGSAWTLDYDGAGTTGSTTTTTTAGIRVLVRADNNLAYTPAADSRCVVAVRLEHTSGDGVTAVVGDILTGAGTTLVPARSVATLSHDFENLVFPASSSVNDKLAAVLAHGDWYGRFELRSNGSTYVPTYVFAARPTTAAYHIKEGSGPGWEVTADMDPVPSEPLARTVRALYTTTAGEPRYVDVTDTNTTHYLVAQNITKTVSLDTGQETSTGATAVANRYLVDAGRDQYSGTVTIDGAPEGRIAADYKPGELLTIWTRQLGTITARITSAVYTGEHHAVLRLDSAPDLQGIVARMGVRRTPMPTLAELRRVIRPTHSRSTGTSSWGSNFGPTQPRHRIG